TMKKCFISSGLKNENSSICDALPYMKIKSDCKSSLKDECNVTNLSENLNGLYPEKFSFLECNIDLITSSNDEVVADTCFKWINANLIDSTLVLNVEAMKQLSSLIQNGKVIKNLRNLISSDDVVYS